ncbi:MULTISPECIES: hypothetical protein [Magnetospirillum]|uniref:DUF1311 domain-containing protein n=1 Tax=Magnetospirillum aberrantis SpK TaxID=908842 RepID=A0A7C9QVZ1_9PROT|nr:MULTISPECIES: hypothetical protein [Magnetospirillum]NFV81905.1 hypothetical protein [Magnetospirillum aberrantis SpK]OJX78258.1 MAG: hypothetical protein BGO92_02480 [Magnetospirillum sp. 64-120]
MIRSAVAALLLGALTTAPSSAFADMYGFPNGGYTPTPEQRAQQQRALEMKRKVTECDGLRQQVVRTVNTWVNQVYANSYDMSDQGWVQHNSREIFMRDTREEMARFQEAMRQLTYGEVDVSACQATAARYRGYVECYFTNTMNNEPRRNRSDCGSDLYSTFVNPDLYYPPD